MILVCEVCGVFSSGTCEGRPKAVATETSVVWGVTWGTLTDSFSWSFSCLALGLLLSSVLLLWEALSAQVAQLHLCYVYMYRAYTYRYYIYF